MFDIDLQSRVPIYEQLYKKTIELIIKGVLLLLQDVLCGVPLEEAAGLRTDLLQEAGLSGVFSDTRQKGIGAAIEMLRDSAEKMMQQDEGLAAAR